MEAIASSANGKAPGPTGEIIEMLKWLDRDNIKLVKGLFNTDQNQV